MAFIRWNESTEIWEIAVDPNNPSTLFNHLRVANPTLPLDTANKQYVDAAVAGVSGFVPYIGATANVNLGAFNIIATKAQFGTSSVAATVNIGPGGNPWTNVGWTKGIELSNLATIKFNHVAESTIFWGVGQSGASLYFIRSSADNNSSGAAYALILQSDGAVIVPSNGVIAGAQNFMVGDSFGSAVTQGYVGMQVNFNDICQIAVKSNTFGTQGGIFVHTDTVYMGAWSLHPLALRAGNVNRLIIYADATGRIQISGGLPPSPAAPGDLYDPGDGLVRIGH